MPAQEMLVESHQELNVAEMKSFFDSILTIPTQESHLKTTSHSSFDELSQKIMDTPWSQTAANYAFDCLIQRALVLEQLFNHHFYGISTRLFIELTTKIFKTVSVETIRRNSRVLLAVVGLDSYDQRLLELKCSMIKMPPIPGSFLTLFLSYYPEPVEYLLLKGDDLTFSKIELEKMSLKINVNDNMKTVDFFQLFKFLRPTKESEFPKWVSVFYEKLGLLLAPSFPLKMKETRQVDNAKIVTCQEIKLMLSKMIEIPPDLPDMLSNGSKEYFLANIEKILVAPWSPHAGTFAFHFFLERFALVRFILNYHQDLKNYFSPLMEKIFSKAPIESIRGRHRTLADVLFIDHLSTRCVSSRYHKELCSAENYGNWLSDSLLASILNTNPETCRSLFLKPSGMLIFSFNELAEMKLFVRISGRQQKRSFFSYLEFLDSCSDSQGLTQWLPDFYTQLGKSLIENLQSNTDAEFNMINDLDEVSKKLGQLSNKHIFAIWLDFGCLIMDRLIMARGENPHVTVSTDPKIASVLAKIVDELKTYCQQHGWAAVGRDKQPVVVNFMINYVALQVNNSLSPEVRHAMCTEVAKSYSEGRWPNLENLRCDYLHETKVCEEPFCQCTQVQSQSEEKPKKQRTLDGRKKGQNNRCLIS